LDVCILFSDVGVLTYDAGAPSGGERTSICRNTPSCWKVEREIPSMC